VRIVTVARKPCASSSTTANVVEHEAGALNIDASRIRPLGISGEVFAPAAGRWPGNVLLVHRGTCRVVGTRKVATGTAHRKNSGGRTIFSETEKPAMDDMTYADADGKETVSDWSCEPGCPVAELDRQSGMLTSGSGTVKRASSAGRDGNKGSAYGAENRADGTPMIWYGDTGGASRFFKGFGGEGSEG
jgi:hypothetical protein